MIPRMGIDHGTVFIQTSTHFKTIHCKGTDQHKNRPICGKIAPSFRCWTRQEFKLLTDDNKCKLCARTRFARFI